MSESTAKVFTDFRISGGVPSWHCYIDPSIDGETALRLAEQVRDLVFRRMTRLDEHSLVPVVATERHCFSNAVNNQILRSTKSAEFSTLQKAEILPEGRSPDELFQLNLRVSQGLVPSIWPTDPEQGVEAGDWSNGLAERAVYQWMQAGNRAFESLTAEEEASIEESWRNHTLNTATVNRARELHRKDSLRTLLSTARQMLHQRPVEEPDQIISADASSADNASIEAQCNGSDPEEDVFSRMWI